MSIYWNSPLLDTLLDREVQERRDSYEALKSVVTPQMAQNAAAIAQAYQQFPASMVAGLAVAGVSPEDPAMLELGDRIAAEQAGQGRGNPGPGVGYNVQEPDSPGFFGKIGEGIKAGVKGLFLAFDFLWEEGLQRPLRAAVGNYQANRPWYEVAFAPFFPKSPGYKSSGPSIGNIALHAALQGQKVNLGTGWFLDSTLGAETERQLAQGVPFMQAISNPEQMELGVPISQLQRHWREQTQIAAGPGSTDTIHLTPGRLIATQFVNQKEDEFNLASGILDFAANVVLDPANIFMGAAAKARKVAKTVVPNGRVPSLFGRTWGELLATPHGNQIVEDLGAIQDYQTIFDILRRSERGVSPELPQIASSLARADAAGVRGILNQMGQHSAGLSQVPSPQSLIGRATGRQGTPIINALSRIAGRGRTPAAAARLGGPAFSIRYSLEGTWMGKQMAQVGAKAIHLDDLGRGITDIQEWMRGAGFTGDRISFHMQALADAQARIKMYDKFTSLPSQVPDHYDTVFSVVTGMVDEWSMILEAQGLPKAGVRAFGQIFKDAREMRNYFRNAADNPQFFPGAKMKVLVDGQIHTMESAHLWSEFLNRAIPLPDARKVRVAMRRASINEHLPHVGEYLNKNVTDWEHVGDNVLMMLGDAYMQKVWKPLVLLRVAWPVRVVGEEQLRMAIEGLANVFTHPVQSVAWAMSRSVGDLDVIGNKMDDALRFQETMSGHGLQNILNSNGVRRSSDQWLSVRKGDPRWAEGVHNPILLLHKDPAARALAGGPSAYHAPMDDLTSAFHPYLDDQVPRLQRAAAFDALPDEANVWVFHSTDRELADRLVSDGYTPGAYSGTSTGAMEHDVLYVATEFRKLKLRYGEGELVAMRVPKSHLRSSEEMSSFGRNWLRDSDPTTGASVIDPGHGAVIHAPVPADRIYRIIPADYDGKPTPLQLIGRAVQRTQLENMPVREMSVEELLAEFGENGLAFHGTDATSAHSIVGTETPPFSAGGVTGSLREALGFAQPSPGEPPGNVVVWLRRDLHPDVQAQLGPRPKAGTTGYTHFEGDVTPQMGGRPYEQYQGLDNPLALIDIENQRAYVYPRGEFVTKVPARKVGPQEVKEMFYEGELSHIRAAMASEGGNRSLLHSKTYSDGYIDSVNARLHYSIGGDYNAFDPAIQNYWDSAGQRMRVDEVEAIMGEPLVESQSMVRLQDRQGRGKEISRNPYAQELVARDELSRLAEVFTDENGNFDREAFAQINASFGHLAPMDPIPTDWADDVYLVGGANVVRHNAYQSTALHPDELPSARSPRPPARAGEVRGSMGVQIAQLEGLADDVDVALQQLDQAMAAGDAQTVTQILNELRADGAEWIRSQVPGSGPLEDYEFGQWVNRAFPYDHPSRPPVAYAADQTSYAFQRFAEAVEQGDDIAAAEALDEFKETVRNLGRVIEEEARFADTTPDDVLDDLTDTLDAYFGTREADLVGLPPGERHPNELPSNWEEMADALASGEIEKFEGLITDFLEDTRPVLEGELGVNPLMRWVLDRIDPDHPRQEDLVMMVEDATVARDRLKALFNEGELSEALNVAEDVGVSLASIREQIEELQNAGDILPVTGRAATPWEDPWEPGFSRMGGPGDYIMGRATRPEEARGYQWSSRIRPQAVYVVRGGHITARMEFEIGGRTSSAMAAKEAAETGIIHISGLYGPGPGDPEGRLDVLKLFRLLIDRDLIDPNAFREIMLGDHSMMEIARASAKHLLDMKEEDIPKTWEGMVELIHRSGGAVGAWAMPENNAPTMTMLSSELMGRILNQMTRRGGTHTNPLHVDNLRHNRVMFNVTRTGHPELQEAIATGKLRGMDITDPKNYREIYELYETEFRDFLPEFGKVTKQPDRTLSTQWDKAVTTMFSWLMSKPTNYLSRSPAFRQYYWRKIGELMPLADAETQATMLMRAKEAGIGKDSIRNFIERIAKGGGELPDEAVIRSLEKMISEGGGGIALKANLASQGGLAGSIQDIDHLDDVAKAFALEQTRRLLYDLSKKSNFFDMTRLIFPFGEAWYEIISTWGRLVRENPQALRRLQQGVEGARESGFFYEDPNTGEEVFNYPGADLLAKWMFDPAYKDQMGGDPAALGRGEVAGPQMTGRVLGLNLMLGSWIPGMGPLVQIPASQLGFLQEPDWKFVRELVLPFGATDVESVGDILDTQLPAWFRKALVALGKPTGDDERLYGNTVIDVYRAMLLNGADDSTPEAAARLMEEAKAKAKTIYRIRALAQFAGPTGAMVRWDATDQEGKTWAMQSLATEYRVILDKNNYDQGAAFREFVKVFGLDPSGLYTAKSRSVRRRSVTEAGAIWEHDNAQLFEDFPLTAYYGRPDDPDEPFDYNAYLKQLKDRNRVPLSPEEWQLERNDFLGRIAYEQARRQASAYGDSVAVDSWLRNIRYQLMNRYPGFNQPLVGGVVQAERDQVILELEGWRNSPQLMATETGQGVALYMDARDLAKQQSEWLGLSPLGFQSAARTKMLRDWLRTIAQDAIRQYPDFGVVWDQVLSSELSDQSSEFNLMGVSF